MQILLANLHDWTAQNYLAPEWRTLSLEKATQMIYRKAGRVTAPPHPLEVDFTEPIRMTGYELIKIGETWEVDVWWETYGPLSTNYLVFVHLIGPDDALIAQHDHVAGTDAYPTSQWAVGTMLRDRFFLNVPGGVCDQCTLHVGLYTEQGRLPLRDGGDAVEIGTGG